MGSIVGEGVGTLVGMLVVGRGVGARVGAKVGPIVGRVVGLAVGLREGAKVGETLRPEGARDGLAVQGHSLGVPFCVKPHRRMHWDGATVEGAAVGRGVRGGCDGRAEGACVGRAVGGGMKHSTPVLVVAC